MVVDTLKNIEIYKGLSPDIYAGLQFLAESKPEIELGVYPINDNVKAIVSSYKTVDEFERGYESHKHVIDIQYPIKGLERVKWSPIEGMNVNIPYVNLHDGILVSSNQIDIVTSIVDGVVSPPLNM